MSKPLNQIVDDLPERSWTVRMLQALDFVVPGEWHNLVGFENTIKTLTGETDQKMIQKIGDRAIRLYNDQTQGYQRGLWLYQTVDSVQGLMGFAAMANKVGERFSMLSFLQSITPKSESTQAVDLGVKLVTELVAFCYINGFPGDSVKDFVKSLVNYNGEAKMRMAALICIDGLLPLGPNFVNKMTSMLQSSGVSDLESNERYQKIKTMLPGSTTSEQLGLVQEGAKSVSGWMTDFVNERKLTVDKVLGGLGSYMDYAENKLDYLAAFLDMTCNYYAHTGTQTVAKSAILRAVNEI